MSFIEVNVMGKTGFIATASIVAVLSNVNTKPGSVIYMEEPVGALEVDESAEEVYELIYEATPSEDDDEQEDEQGYEASLEDMQEAYELLMLSAWTPTKEDT